MNFQKTPKTQTSFLDKENADFVKFQKIFNRKTLSNEVTLAIDIQKNIPLYDGSFINKAAIEKSSRKQVLNEWAAVLRKGAGIIIIKRGITDLEIISRATEIFTNLIDSEKLKAGGGGDHFAKAGANDRIWNALEKHCLNDSKNFAHYYSSFSIHLAAEAWLGPSYQMTAQVNRVNPGGEAQKPHRDYHLGFMTLEQAEKYPSHVHGFCSYLTLQGAVAHCDMPIESGPTQLLPFSQQFHEGYLAVGRDEFQNYFSKHSIQMPLEKGDLLFFNPAVFHAAGQNTSTDIYRMANLLQISSALGRSMETVNRHKMSLELYPSLLEAKQKKSLTELELENAIAACAEGYSFPTNLDMDPPLEGHAPLTQAQFVKEALNSDKPLKWLKKQLLSLADRQKS